MKEITLVRKVKAVEREGVTQAKMWLGLPGATSDRGLPTNRGVQMAAVVLLSAQVRTDALLGRSSGVMEIG